MADDLGALGKRYEALAKLGGEGPTPLSMLGQIFGQTVSGLWNLPRRAIEASGQDVQHLGEEGYQRQAVAPATDAAIALFGVGTPLAASGAAGAFGGRLAPAIEALDASGLRYFGSKPAVRDATGKYAAPVDPYAKVGPNPYNPENLTSKTTLPRAGSVTPEMPNPYNPDAAFEPAPRFRGQSGRFSTQADYFRNRVPSADELTGAPPNAFYDAANAPDPAALRDLIARMKTGAVQVDPESVARWKAQLLRSQ